VPGFAGSERFAVSIFGRRYRLVSPLTTREICARFKDTVGWPMFSDREIVGYYDRDGFQLRTGGRFRNSFQTIMYGTFTDRVDHTEVACLAGPRRFVIAFMAIWLLGVITIGSMVTLTSFGQLLQGDVGFVDGITGVLLPVALLVFGVGLFWGGRVLARGEEEKLLQFLDETIEAEVV
jgi:hypothetical protein